MREDLREDGGVQSQGVRAPLWLSHHHEDEWHRCIRAGRFHLCRRCTVLYPTAFVITAWSLSRGGGARLPLWLFALLPAPATVEFVLERLGRVSYVPRRQILVTIPLAVAMGDGFARYLRDPTDLAFWLTVISYGSVAAFSWIWTVLDSSES